MSKLKTFNVTYRAEVRRTATVEATSKEEAREKFDDGDFDDGYEIDCYNIDDICLSEEEYD